MRHSSFTIGGAIREGWELTKVNIGFLIVYQVILYFFMWLFSDISDNWRPTFIHLIGFIILTLGKMGFYQSALLLTRGLKPSFNQFYANWRLLLSWVIASLLFGLMFVTGFFLFIIPAFFVWSIFGFYPFFILDKGLGPIEALKASAKFTQGIRWQVFLFFLACTGLDLLGILFFGVGFLLSAPVTLIAATVIYQKITGQSRSSIQPDDIIP